MILEAYGCFRKRPGKGMIEDLATVLITETPNMPDNVKWNSIITLHTVVLFNAFREGLWNRTWPRASDHPGFRSGTELPNVGPPT